MSEGIAVGLQLGTQPPLAAVTAVARYARLIGLRCLMTIDHFQNIFPSAIWDEQFSWLAARRSTPHEHFDYQALLGYLAARFPRLQLGVGVTESIRRHPVLIAQTMLTLAQMTKKAPILGIGAVERMNIDPYGLDYAHPVSRLDEALQIIRLCFTQTGPISVTASTSLRFDEPGNAVWFGGVDGTVYSCRLLGRRLTKHGDGWADLLAVIPVPDGLTVIVILGDGDIFLRPRADAGRPPAAAPAVPTGRPLRAATMLADGDLVVLTTDGSVCRVAPLAGVVSTIADGFLDAVGLVVDEAAAQVVLAQAGASPSLQRIDLLTGATVGSPLGLAGPPVAVTGHPGGAGVLVADTSGLVSAVLWGGSDPWTTLRAMPVTSLCRWFSLVIALGGDGIASSKLQLFEWGDDAAKLPVSVGFEPVAVGGWSSFSADYTAAGLTEADVRWEILEGPHAGSVSVARPPEAAPDAYEHCAPSAASARGPLGPSQERVQGVDHARERWLAKAGSAGKVRPPGPRSPAEYRVPTRSTPR